VIELGGRLIVLLSPGRPAIHRDRRPAVVAVDQAARIARIDPERMMIPVWGGQQLEVLATVGGAEGTGVEHVDGIACDRVGEDVRVVPGPLAKAVVLVDAAPVGTAVIRAEDTALLRFDRCIDALAVCPRDGDADAAQRGSRKPMALDLLPGQAVIRGAIQAGARATAGEAPRLAPHLPQRSEHDVRMMRVESKIDRPRITVTVQDSLPSLAAISCSKDSALLIGAKRMAERGDQHDLRVAGIHDDGADLPGVVQTHMLPGLARINRLVDAIAVGDVASRASLTGPHIENVVV